MNNDEIISQYYTAHRPALLAYVSSALHGSCEAEDIVQNVFLRLLSGDGLMTEATLPSLVYTTARRLIIDYYRRHATREQYVHHAMHSSDADTTTESLISANDISELLEQKLTSMPASCREVYRLHVYGGMKVSEISVALDQGYKSVEHHLGVARKEIRNFLLQHVS